VLCGTGEDMENMDSEGSGSFSTSGQNGETQTNGCLIHYTVVETVQASIFIALLVSKGKGSINIKTPIHSLFRVDHTLPIALIQNENFVALSKFAFLKHVGVASVSCFPTILSNPKSSSSFLHF